MKIVLKVLICCMDHLFLHQMKQTIIILYACLCCLTGMAQQESRPSKQKVAPNDSIRLLAPAIADTHPQPTAVTNIKGCVSAIPEDTLRLPPMNAQGQVLPINMYPYSYWNGFYNWNLHRGLNINIGASVFAFFGKNAPHGAGFAQNISAMYAIPLNNKLSLAVGGYFDNTSWSHDSYRDAGLSAVLGYRFNEHWEAYLYAQKSIVNTHRIPYPLYTLNNIGDRIGAAVKYNVNPNFSFQVSFDSNRVPRSWEFE